MYVLSQQYFKKNWKKRKQLGEEDPLKVEASLVIGTIFFLNILAKNGVFTKKADKYTPNLISFHLRTLGLFSVFTEYKTKGKVNLK